MESPATPLPCRHPTVQSVSSGNLTCFRCLEKEGGKLGNQWDTFVVMIYGLPGLPYREVEHPMRSGLLSNAPKSNLKDDRVVVTRRLGYRKRENVTASRDDIYRVFVSAREGEG